MTPAREKTLYYRRFQWLNAESKSQCTLEELLREAHSELDSSVKRVLEYGDGSLQGMDCQQNRSQLLLHVASYTPNQPASLVPLPSEVTNILNTTDQPPPHGHNFMEGDIFILVSRNQVILCPCGLRESAAIGYIYGIIEKAESVNVDMAHSEIVSIASLSTIDLIRREGVRSFSLNTSLFKASHSYHKRTVNGNRPRHLQMLKEFAETFFSSEKQMSNAERAMLANLSTTLEVSIDGRMKEGEVSQQAITDLASAIFEQNIDDGISIVTRSNTKLTHDKIRLCKKIKISASGSSVSKLEAWSSMEAYFEELLSKGMLSQ